MRGNDVTAIIRKAKDYLPTLDEERVMRAYQFAKEAHDGQVRFSGDPYITHPVAALELLLPLKPDEDTMVACLLHDVIGNTPLTVWDVEKGFGRAVAELAQNVEKLSLVKVRDGHAEMESWRKMFMAMARDLRVIFIRLADRLHNMQTLEYVAESKQRRIAEETLQVYAPIASRLGIYSMKGRLEDLCFQYLYPEEYENIRQQVEAYGQVNDVYIERAKKVIEEFLEEEGIEAEVSGRIKHLYSIYRKLKRKNSNTIDSIYDLFAMRIVLPDQFREGVEFTGHCYTTLGGIHQEWTPVPGRFKDYIAVPKLNGYRSLHTTIIGKKVFINRPVEIQIRTGSMHEEAEYGIASHWWYEDKRPIDHQISRDDVQSILKERRLVARFYEILDEHPDRRSEFETFLSERGASLPKKQAEEIRQFLHQAGLSTAEVGQLRQALSGAKASRESLRPFQHHVDWLYSLGRIQEDIQKEAPSDALPNKTASVDVFQDRIFVLTPHGDVKDLPMEATPVDFAYSIHSEIGNQCYQARVNGAVVKLDHVLKSGDVVEIVTRKNSAPNRYWLSFVKTDTARNRIKAWFRTQDRDKNIKAGKEMLNKELRRMSKPLLGPNYSLLKNYGENRLSHSEREYVVESVGNGMITINTVMRNLFSERELCGELQEKPPVHEPMLKESEDSEQVLITGEDKLPVVLAACCKPKFPHAIVGYVTRGKAIRVHKKGCKQLVNVDKNRLLGAEWAAAQPKQHYQAKIRLKARDRVGLLRDVMEQVAELGISVVDFPLIKKEENHVERSLIVEVSDYDLLKDLLSRLEKVQSVISVKKEE